MKGVLAVSVLGLLSLGSGHVFAQSLGNAGTIEGRVVDPSGAAVAKAAVTIHNAVTGYNNFLSTFSGTHFLQPRTVIVRVGLVF